MKYKARYFGFFTAMTLFHLASNFAHPVTPTIIQELNLPDYLFGLALAVMMTANFLLSPSWGKINQSISSRSSLLVCSLGYAAAQLGFAYSTTMAQILVARAAAGVFISGIFVSLLTYVVNTARPEDQAKYLTYSATIHSVFGAFGYLIGGFIGEYSIKVTFVVQAVTLCASGLLFRVVCLPDAQTSEKVLPKQLLKEANPLKAFSDSRQFLDGAFLLLFLVNILINFGNTGFDQAFNYFLKDQLKLTSSYNGIIKAAVGFVSFVCNMTLCIWLIRKTDTRVSMLVLTAVCTLSAAATIFSPKISAFIIWGILLYAGYSVSIPVLQHMVATYADPGQKNLVMGFYNATKSLGSIAGSLAVGFLYSLHVKLPFAFVAGAYGLAVAAAFGYMRCRSAVKGSKNNG